MTARPPSRRRLRQPAAARAGGVDLPERRTFDLVACEGRRPHRGARAAAALRRSTDGSDRGAGRRDPVALHEARGGCGRLRAMVPESRLEATEHGLVPKGDGWFVLNAREARWLSRRAAPRFASSRVRQDFPQLGINLSVLGPGEPMAMYHWEADQEDFLVLAGEALLIVEGEERPLRRWDFVHCPPGDEAHHRRGGRRAMPGARSRRPRPLDRPGLGRLHAWTRPRCATARASSRRRPTRRRRTRDSPSADRPGTRGLASRLGA